jgi:hypothetical protein
LELRFLIFDCDPCASACHGIDVEQSVQFSRVGGINRQQTAGNPRFAGQFSGEGEAVAHGTVQWREGKDAAELIGFTSFSWRDTL